MTLITRGYTVGDLEPSFKFVCKDGPKPANLSAALSVAVHLVKTDRAKIDRPGLVGNQALSPGSGTMDWEAGDLSCDGTWTGEVQVMWPGDRPQTFGPTTFPVKPQLL